MPERDNTSRTDARLAEAIAHHRSGRLDEAEALYKKLVAARPDHADALHLLGVIAQQRGKPAAAVKLLEKAMALAPGQAAYASDAAEAYRALGNLDRALIHALRAVELDPRSPGAHNNLGMVFQQQRRQDPAIAHFERAIELNPFLPVPYDNLAAVLASLGRHPEAAAMLAEGLRLNPGAPQLIASLARVRAALPPPPP